MKTLMKSELFEVGIFMLCLTNLACTYIYPACSFQIVNDTNLPILSTLTVFFHEGLSSFENGIMIAKYWRKLYSTSGLEIDVENILVNCLELSNLFSGNIAWSKGTKSQIITKFQPKYVYTLLCKLSLTSLKKLKKMVLKFNFPVLLKKKFLGLMTNIIIILKSS